MKSYKITDLDCPCCAAKIEAAVSKLEGVESAKVSFLAQRLVVAAQEKQEAILREAVRIARKIEPACTIVC